MYVGQCDGREKPFDLYEIAFDGTMFTGQIHVAELDFEELLHVVHKELACAFLLGPVVNFMDLCYVNLENG